MNTSVTFTKIPVVEKATITILHPDRPDYNTETYTVNKGEKFSYYGRSDPNWRCTSITCDKKSTVTKEVGGYKVDLIVNDDTVIYVWWHKNNETEAT